MVDLFVTGRTTRSLLSWMIAVVLFATKRNAAALHNDLNTTEPRLETTTTGTNIEQNTGSKKTSSPPSTHSIYIDIEAANTTHHLHALRQIPLNTYRLSYESSPQSSHRVRVGMIDHEALSAIIPDAVEIIPERKFPNGITVKNLPVVNDQTLFYYGVGAIQELAKMAERTRHELDTEIVSKITELNANFQMLDDILSDSGESYDGEIRRRTSIAQARSSKAKIELEIQSAQDEQDATESSKQREIEEIQRQEELMVRRFEREEQHARREAEAIMSEKIKIAEKMERARLAAGEELSKLEHERSLEVQRLQEKMKEETEKAIAKAKAQAERENEDLQLRRLKAESEQKRKRNLAAIQTLFHHLAYAFTSASQQPKKVILFIGYMALLAIGIYTAREGARLCRILAESAIGKPKLVRETTKKSILQDIIFVLEDYLLMLQKLWSWVIGGDETDLPSSSSSAEKKCQAVFQDLILSKSLKDRVVTLAVSTSKARQNDAPHRHLLLYGPPGTGKTMIARKLAQCVGMDYALMSGGDVGPLGSDAVTQIHSLFTWAKFSKRGVLLFIDEAEAFLGDRSKGNGIMSESAHNALNALLYNTGGDRGDFMLVLATNRVEDLDAAILDRCDESLFIPLPDPSCRSKLLSLYFETSVKKTCEKLQEKQRCSKSLFLFLKRLSKVPVSTTQEHRKWDATNANNIITIDDNVMTGSQLEKAVQATDGFSGREIGKVMIAMQSCFYATIGGTQSFSRADAWRVMDIKVTEHKDKQRMINEEV